MATLSVGGVIYSSQTVSSIPVNFSTAYRLIAGIIMSTKLPPTNLVKKGYVYGDGNSKTGTFSTESWS